MGMDPLVAHQRAQDTFAHVLVNVTSDQLSSPTPCPEWDVKALIDHVIAGNQRVAERAGGQVAPIPEDLGAAHRALGSTLYYLGDDPAAASRHLQVVIGSEALARDRSSFLDELHDVTDPWITCHAYQSWSMWLTGRPAEAKRLCQRTLDLSAELQHPFTRALAFSFGSWLYQWQGDAELVHKHATDAYAVAQEQGFAGPTHTTLAT